MALAMAGCPQTGPGTGNNNNNNNGEPASVTVTIFGQGTVDQSAQGNMVTLTANPGTGWDFDRWSEADVDDPEANPITVDATDIETITATFIMDRPSGPVCGDSVLDRSEECDDGNTDDADACPSTCVLCSGAEAFMLPDNRHCYTRHAGPASWQVAREACADAGGHLATYTTEFESTRVAATLLRTNDAWIGLFYRIMVQNIQWVTEEPLLVTQWRRNEGTFGNGICIQQGSTVPGAPEPGLWFGAPCTREASYVCERAGWLLRSDDNHAYRAFYKLVTWDQAAAACAAVGGHLATITSDKEKDFVAAFSGSLWLGAHDKDQDGVFAWTTGEPFAYHNFAPNEPDNAIKGVDCIAVTNDRLWRDRGCSDIYGFLCEFE